MAETQDPPKAGVISKAGGPESGTPGFIKHKDIDPNPSPNPNPSPAPSPAPSPDPAPAPPADLTDEQLKAYFEKQGITYGGIDDLKGKLAKADQPIPETEEEKKARELETERRMVQHYLEKGGTVEQLAAVREIVNMDLTQLAKSDIVAELKEAGFKDAEIEIVLQERYFQLDPENLTKNEGETEEEFKERKALAIKKKQYGDKKLASRATNTKKQAEEVLSQLRKAIETTDLQASSEREFASKVDDFAKTVARKRTFDIGEIDGQKIDPITADVSEADIAEVVAELKDPAKRKQFSTNPDGSFNLSTVFELLLSNRFLKDALKSAYLISGTRTVSDFQKRFPGRTGGAIGVGGTPGQGTGQKGVITKAGEPEFVGHKKK